MAQVGKELANGSFDPTILLPSSVTSAVTTFCNVLLYAGIHGSGGNELAKASCCRHHHPAA